MSAAPNQSEPSATGDAVPDARARAGAWHMRTERLTVRYGDREALRDLTLAFPRAAVTAVIGPNGGGKSTLLRGLCRLHDLDAQCETSGTVWLDDVEIYDERVDVKTLRRRVAYVFPLPNPFPRSILDNVGFGPRIHGVHSKTDLMEIVERTLTLAALWDEVKDRLSESALQLNVGQQQRLCLARALANSPDVLLLDEPLAGLPPGEVDVFEDAIRGLGRELTTILATHNRHHAARVSNWTAFILDGTLVEMDRTDNIFTNPAQALTQQYITGRLT